jgi:cytochrome c
MGQFLTIEALARMQTTDTNKTLMCLLMVLLLTKGLGVFTAAIYAPPSKVVGGFPLPSGEATAAKPAAAPAEVPLPTLLAKADLKKGEADVKVCQSCHSLEKGGVAKVGPPLWGVVGRPKGSIAGFGYSDGMKAMGGNWTYDDLNKFITKPMNYVSGTKMTYPGEQDPAKRADIIDYLHTLSDAPLALPN